MSAVTNANLMGITGIAHAVGQIFGRFQTIIDASLEAFGIEQDRFHC